MRRVAAHPIADASPPQWIARATARGLADLAALLLELDDATPEGARLFRLVAMREVGKGQRYDVKALYERIPQPGDPPQLAPLKPNHAPR